jgi:hypothetical protein
MVYGKWLVFYMHVVWRSRTNGVLQIWYRGKRQTKFTKLYSNVPRDRALIRVDPHPTLLYNTENGAPGENGKPGLVLEGGFYRGNTDWTNVYWWDGMRRRQSESSILAGFPNPASRRTSHRRSGLSGLDEDGDSMRRPVAEVAREESRPSDLHRLRVDEANEREGSVVDAFHQPGATSRRALKAPG